MEWLSGNSFFVLVLLVCIGMHFFGHGHGHGEHVSKDGEDTNGDNNHKGRNV